MATMQINKRLNTKVDVDKDIDISLFKKFPELSVDFRNVKIYEPNTVPPVPFAQLEHIYITFDLMDMWKGSYHINQLFLDKGYIHLRTDPNGNHNFNILKKDSTASTDDDSDFSIAFIQLKNVDFQYDYKPGFQVYNVYSTLTEASLSYADNLFSFKVDSDWHSEGMYIKDNSFLVNKTIALQTHITYNTRNQVLIIKPSNIKIDKAEFAIKGYYDILKNYIDIAFQAEKSSIQTFTSMMPEEYAKPIEAYQSSGKVYFEGLLKGDMNNTSPAINVRFGFENATFYHPKYKQTIKKAYLTGVFTNGVEKQLRTSSLKLSDMRFELDNRSIEGFFYLTNLDDPMIDTRLRGAVDLAHLLRMYPNHPFDQATGELDFDVEFKGKSNDLKTKIGYQNIYTAGDLGLTNIVAKFKSYPHIVRIQNAICTFNKNDISISDMSLKVGKNQVNMSGIFRNLIGKIIFPDQAMYIQADLEMGNIFLEEILMADQRNNNTSDQGFIMPLLKDYKMELSLKAMSMKYEKFYATNISSNIQWNYPLLTFSNSSLNFCSGKYTGITSLRAINEKLWEIKTDSKIRSMNIDSLFYVFENFSQNFITNKNLKGQISSDISLLLQLDNHLNILPASIICDADLTVHNGELNNFETMKKMARFLDAEDLDNIKFSEMNNHFLIYNQEIQIPEMTIISTAGKIGVSGKHAFDGRIEYHVAYPIKNLKKGKTDSDEAFGAIRKDPKGEMNVFLIIKGTTNDFKISYDKKKTGEKIVSDIQKEKEELKALFKRKDDAQQQIRQGQQEEQEYFDF